MSAAAHSMAFENHHKRTHSPSLPAGAILPPDLELPSAKRPCSTNHCCTPPLQTACCAAQAQFDAEAESFSRPAEFETTAEKLWPDPDERAICEMISSLEQAIRSDGPQRHTEDSASSSSCPHTDTAASCDGISRAGIEDDCSKSTSESEYGLDFLADGNASIDDGIQQLLQEAEDQNILFDFCENWEKCSSASSDYAVPNSELYACEDELGVVYNPLLDPISECSLD